MFDNGATITDGIADVLSQLESHHSLMAESRALMLAADLDKLLRALPAGAPNAPPRCGADVLGFGRENILRLRQEVDQVLFHLGHGAHQAAIAGVRRAQREWLQTLNLTPAN